MKINQEQFEAYERVRASGVTNMWAVSVVSDLSGLEKDTIMQIMKNYSELKDKFACLNCGKANDGAWTITDDLCDDCGKLKGEVEQ